MTNESKLCILGGDERQRVAAELLAADGCEVAVWGMDAAVPLIGATRCTGWTDACTNADAVLLPLPCSSDGIHLYCPMLDPRQTVPTLETLFAELTPGTPVIGGRITPPIRAAAEDAGLRITDISADEAFCVANAVPTAEGAIGIAMAELPVTLAHARAGIIGYGRIGRVLAQLLIAMHAEVTVYARSAEARTWAETAGCRAALISDLADTAETEVLFNTVPAVLLTAPLLTAIVSKGTPPLIIDLASAPGGTDTDSAAAMGIHVIRALALPGKAAPVTAGRILYTHTRRLLRTLLGETNIPAHTDMSAGTE